MTDKPATRKTPRQRAQENRERARKRASEATTRLTSLRSKIAAAEAEEREAKELQAHAETHPALKMAEGGEVTSGTVTTSVGGGAT